MARPKKVIRPLHKKVAIPEDLATMVDMDLFSELEGKVPFEAWSKYIVRLIREDRARRGLQNP